MIPRQAAKLAKITQSILDEWEIQKRMTENEIASICVDAIYTVYREMGPGLLESVYQKVLLYELKKEGLMQFLR